jgi:diaminohydroxyphosphoribosylaminopyrimidine deaminase / 5-amino-6-(5-phosphoribosylamino)uracil reductase
MPEPAHVRLMLDRAARAALRARGDVEPNPLVGCIIEQGGNVIGIGHHRKFGGLHAEREALADCKRRGHDPRGATMFCTLEPCSHHGKQPPCTDAVIEAGIARMLYARPDPAEISGGGGAILRAAGIDARCVDESPLATHISDPFVHRVRNSRPWVIAKWAQTIDGRIATRTGESQWITGPLMRRRVHRLRSMVDAVVVGRGTVVADDPMLTARDTPRVRRTAMRVILDTNARTPPDSLLIASASSTPTAIITGSTPSEFPPAIRHLRVDSDACGIDMEDAFRALYERLGVSTLLVEAGPRVLGALLEADLIDEAYVHLAPLVLGDSDALPVSVGRTAPRLSDARRFSLVRVKPLADDLELHYRRRPED